MHNASSGIPRFADDRQPYHCSLLVKMYFLFLHVLLSSSWMVAPIGVCLNSKQADIGDEG